MQFIIKFPLIRFCNEILVTDSISMNVNRQMQS